MNNLGYELADILTNYVFPFLTVAAVLWAIWLGIQFGTAKDEQTRSAAKSRLVKAFATVVIIAVLWAIMFWLGGGKK